METTHRLSISDARDLSDLAGESIDLVVTSPPYPMIRMWDDLFAGMSGEIGSALSAESGNAAFEAMHRELDKVWRELFRVLKPGSFACVNIGDATRSIGGRFRLYPNHARIVANFQQIGFDTLPVVLWRKQTNAPNKFMGSGMLPSGAYVTLEHEYILIFRKGAKREFASVAGKSARMKSAFFWEERNRWFSDVWDFKGTPQDTGDLGTRERSAAFPFELAYRLVNMYSLYGDTVLDPFMGTGTTALASIACGRNSLGIEIDDGLARHAIGRAAAFLPAANDRLARRLADHDEFIASYTESKSPPKYRNRNHGFPVVTRQETEMELFRVSGITRTSDLEMKASYEKERGVRREERGERKEKNRR